MRYDVEQAVDPTEVFNYFASHQMGPAVIRLGENVWQALVSDHAAGYMVQNPVPDDQYFCERMHWVATANIFMDAANPYEMLVDAYPIHADIPAPTTYMSTGAADSAGVAAFISTADYNTKLQVSLDTTITRSFLQAIQNAKSNNVPWWYFAQVHGELDFNLGKYRACDGTNGAMLRPPSPEEIRVMVNLALAYGAKGIFYFLLETGSATSFRGCSPARFPGLVPEGTLNHSSNYGTLPTRPASGSWMTN